MVFDLNDFRIYSLIKFISRIPNTNSSAKYPKTLIIPVSRIFKSICKLLNMLMQKVFKRITGIHTKECKIIDFKIWVLVFVSFFSFYIVKKTSNIELIPFAISIV